MKLPKFESAADLTAMGSAQHYTSDFNHAAMGGVEMNGIFDTIWGGIKDVVGGVVGKVPCVLSKAGPKGISCLAQCGPNPGCLATCAGPALVNSIMECV